ncbi:hypothetical protein JQ557_34660 [Bradyrhizobium sp. U87765 SZCCT0131]|uniref:hypothetical protein n=1 Tax=unclassified Bradyrhizobium TaxID=2631580 RepID=UPI001BA90F21|nr:MULTISPECIES: hypothetical protein [unclassified Bradyrhizobium]MBR1223184.1 hypothetical protein [Bradyrhizobium sp. U87765 SZCCT0131]MBR1265805.1 hypothetical protein [Bradyrhizobium sp. U87765 SZCCT0134]MBR1309402.1 hypothetical protein [Bradyrhizobium sp. U87765 SZCCT0110]MBR1324080.1 hypothetical protein [Bradyrhizobium sp. U87765 SZCCT0109]MBR1348229.1 hypothetical protein [Bradyrhizobium sp. U87765 SZCCT0048]
MIREARLFDKAPEITDVLRRDDKFSTGVILLRNRRLTKRRESFISPAMALPVGRCSGPEPKQAYALQ